MRQKKNRYIVEAVKKMIKARDLKPSKDAKGGVQAQGPDTVRVPQGGFN
jgi:hypothetical protein